MHLKAVKILRRICGILQGQQLVAGRSPLDRGGDTGVLQHVNSPGGSIEGNLSSPAVDRFAGVTDLFEASCLQGRRRHAVIGDLLSNSIDLLFRKLRQPVALGQGLQGKLEAPPALLPPGLLQQIVLRAVGSGGPGNLKISICPVGVVLQVALHIPPPCVLAVLNSQPGEIQVRGVPRATLLHVPRERPIQGAGLGGLLGVTRNPVNPGVSHLLGNHRQLLPEPTLVHGVEPVVESGSHDLSPWKFFLDRLVRADVVGGVSWPPVIPNPVGD
mmetsp:Transcript_10794/g.23510  ORF Transcript_10794/g.23510 Transcript_10794/m.23510 type:complete len:272 (-) Transcript_10794:799-1614(-)